MISAHATNTTFHTLFRIVTRSAHLWKQLAIKAGQIKDNINYTYVRLCAASESTSFAWTIRLNLSSAYTKNQERKTSEK